MLIGGGMRTARMCHTVYTGVSIRLFQSYSCPRTKWEEQASVTYYRGFVAIFYTFQVFLPFRVLFEEGFEVGVKKSSKSEKALGSCNVGRI